MTDRPTPEQIINELLSTRGRAVVVGRRIGQALVKELAEHGYVIVHTDDIAEQEPNPPFRIAVLHSDETWSYTDGEPIDIATAEQEVPS